MTAPSASRGEFTGRHMLAIMLVFFCIVIAVNVGMAVVAGSSWTGFVVRNSYVASQEFNGKVAAARAQRALGWTATLRLRDGRAELSLSDRDGHDLAPASARLLFRSPATDHLDVEVAMMPGDGALHGPAVLRDGVWVVEIVAVTDDGIEWRDTRRVMLIGGVSR